MGLVVKHIHAFVVNGSKLILVKSFPFVYNTNNLGIFKPGGYIYTGKDKW